MVKRSFVDESQYFITYTDIILSTLEELRQVIENASEDEKGLFLPQRDLTVEYGYPTILAFAHDETRLIVGLDVGSIFVYDTTSLFSSGSGYVHPIRTCDNHTAALRQIAPNPGSGPELRDTIAVVLSDGSVQLVNTMLELLGGWSPRDSPVGAVVGEKIRTCLNTRSLTCPLSSFMVSQGQAPRHRSTNWRHLDIRSKQQIYPKQTYSSSCGGAISWSELAQSRSFFQIDLRATN